MTHTGWTVVGLKVGTLVHLEGEMFVSNTAEAMTEDIRKELEGRGYVFEPYFDPATLGAAERDLRHLQSEYDAILEQIELARAVTPRTSASAQREAELTDALRMRSEPLARAKARRDALSAAAPAAA